MKIDELSAEIQVDSVIDNAELDREALKIPMLHAKYYRFFIDELRHTKALDQKLKEVKRARSDYYLGKADDGVYLDEPLDFKVLKADLDLYLESDAKYSEILMRRDLQKMKTQMLEDFIKTINNRSFLINNAIAWQKFKAGLS